MNLDRKWSRIETAAEKTNWDLFKAIESKPLDEKDRGSVLADIGDLRRYLYLVEEYVTRKDAVKDPRQVTGKQALAQILKEFGPAQSSTQDIMEEEADEEEREYHELDEQGLLPHQQPPEDDDLDEDTQDALERALEKND